MDITKCTNQNCNQRNECLRWTGQSSGINQSYSFFTPNFLGICEMKIDNYKIINSNNAVTKNKGDKKMGKIIITNVKTQRQGVILETNIPAQLKWGNVPSKETFISWDKLGQIIFEDYDNESDVTELNNIREKLKTKRR